MSVRNLLFRCAACVALLLSVSCAGTARKALSEIRIEGVERIEPHAFAGVDLTLRVHNGSRYRLVLREASLGVWYDGVQAGEIVLRDEVTVDRRSDASVLMRWKYCIEDPAALFMIARRLRSGRFDRLGVSYRVVGRGGPARVNISQPEMPLYEFLRTFGVAPEELETYLGL